MQGVSVQFEFPQDQAQFRTAAERAGVELYRAHIVNHAFEPHTHEAYGFGAIESGVERLRCNGSEYVAAARTLVMMNPDDLHTGRAVTEQGWSYQMIYIESDALATISGMKDWCFPDVVIDSDHHRAMRVSALLSRLWQADEPVHFDSLLYQLVMEIKPWSSAQKQEPNSSSHRFTPVIDYMQAHLGERLVLDNLAAVAGLSPFHFLRQFQAQYFVTPHQMLMARRLYAAKQLLTAGTPPAEVAALTGLTDQAHLNRAFVRRYGVTPARYQRQTRK